MKHLPGTNVKPSDFNNFLEATKSFKLLIVNSKTNSMWALNTKQELLDCIEALFEEPKNEPNLDTRKD